MLYLISPALTDVDSPQAERFLEAVAEAIGDSQGCTVLKRVGQIAGVRPFPGDGFGVFTPSPSPEVDDAVVRLLKRAMSGGAQVLPIAIDPQHRGRFDPIAELAPFPVYDWLSARDLPDANIPTVARLYAWSLLAKTRPTFASPDVRIFISYARKHGEDLAARLDRELTAIGNCPIRDNREYRKGEVVRSAIETSLAKCDVLVLLDSHEAQESEWVEWELLTAAKNAMPIVWVDCNAPARDRSKHYVPGRPDMHVDPADVDPAQLADRIDQVARQKLLVNVPDAQRFINCINEWADESDARITDIDLRQGLYEITYPPPVSHYPARPRKHVIQVFARQPRQDDHASLVDWLQREDYAVADKPDRRRFDAAIMAVAAEGEQRFPEDDYSVAESAELYLRNLEAYGVAPGSDDSSGASLLIFGAFPNSSPATDQLIHASRNVTATWLRLGGGISFGGHPTITWHVIHAAAAVVDAESAQKRVRFYQSEFWPPQPRLEEIAAYATVISVPAVSDDREASLEAMRRQMIEKSDAVAAVAIGGRTDEGGTHEPGIRAEAMMARASGIPVFPLGATGGESALLAAENRDTGVEPLNEASDKVNKMLAADDDYSGAAVAIWKSTVG